MRKTIFQINKFGTLVNVKHPRLMCDSCKRPAPVTCPACPARAPPACRRPARSCPRAVRVTCCPPPTAQRPPCPPAVPECPLDCKSAKSKVHVVSENRKIKTKKCGSELDQVVQRHALAEQIRREDYEREASRPPAKARLTFAPYPLAADRLCARATDGHSYTFADSPTCDTCGPNRTPPPPQPLNLVPSEGCAIKTENFPDPCSHRPRVFVSIDRSTSTKDKTDAKPKTGIATRLVDTLSLKKKNKNSSCPRAKCDKPKNWCDHPPKLTPIPPKCIEPTITERLQQRLQNFENQTQRKFHTTVAVSACTSKPTVSDLTNSIRPSSTVDENIDKLTAVLKEKQKLHETGLGRVVESKHNDIPERKSNSGSIELRVPADAEEVKVRVTLDFKDNFNNGVQNSLKNENLVMEKKKSHSDSWLCIRNFQKRIAECTRKSDMSKNKKQKGSPQHKTCSITANPCTNRKHTIKPEARPSRSAPAAPAGPAEPAGSPCASQDRTKRFSTDLHLYNHIALE